MGEVALEDDHGRLSVRKRVLLSLVCFSNNRVLSYDLVLLINLRIFKTISLWFLFMELVN